MSARVECPHCRAMFRVADQYLGRRGKCKHCGQIFDLIEMLEPEDVHRASEARFRDTLEGAGKRVAAGVDQPHDLDHGRRQSPAASTAGALKATRCATCHASLPPGAGHCPRCVPLPAVPLRPPQVGQVVDGCLGCGSDGDGKPLYPFYEERVLCRRCRHSLINRRALAWIVDSLILHLGSFALGCFIGVVAGPQPHSADELAGIGACGGLLLAIVYMLFKDSLHGQSLGRALCRIQVVDRASGAPGGLAASAKRNACLMIPFVPLIAAFQINGGDSSRIGDQLAHTAVIRSTWRERFTHSLPAGLG